MTLLAKRLSGLLILESWTIIRGKKVKKLLFITSMFIKRENETETNEKTKNEKKKKKKKKKLEKRNAPKTKKSKLRRLLSVEVCWTWLEDQRL